MALSKQFLITGKASIDVGGITVNAENHSVELNPYIKVEKVSGSKNNLDIVVSFKDDKTYFEKAYSFEPSMNEDNFIKQAYLYLKTLDEFSDAKDC